VTNFADIKSRKWDVRMFRIQAQLKRGSKTRNKIGARDAK
jgi:hypothetical protein